LAEKKGDLIKSSVSVLHVLTLSGRNGEYGGPVRVAREISKEFSKRGNKVEIFSGAIAGSEPISGTEIRESFILVKPLLRALPVSSLWSLKIVPQLWRKIAKSEIIHIHFARDLIPITAAIISRLQRKPYLAQTHGMIISDGRLSTKITDFIFTKPLLNRSQVTLVLTEIELAQLQKITIKANLQILPNGIEVKHQFYQQNKNRVKRIIFCSRLQKRKGIDKFVELAEHYSSSPGEYVFEIYGPDGGELQKILEIIKKRNLTNLIYKGSLAPEEVSGVLKESDLLVLPSKDEPYPMIVLESLSVGTPVLVMPSCGLANELRRHEPGLVAVRESVDALISGIEDMKNRTGFNKDVGDLTRFCENIFGISKVADRLEAIYQEEVRND
jgi:glycosyltransferase involved in cell wall biosynthesis